MFEVELAPVGFTQSILDFRFWILDSDRSTLKAKNQFTMQCFDCEITLDLRDKVRLPTATASDHRASRAANSR
jgi:hypothetical protein